MHWLFSSASVFVLAGPIDVNASRWPGTQAEVSIAVDRFDPRRVVAAAMNLEQGNLLTMWSDDSGETWSSALLPLPTGATLHADPMVAFDSRGAVFLAVIPVARGNSPLGIEVLRSNDGGRSWSPPVRISKANGRDDKVALAVDDNPESPFRDRVHVAWKWPSGGTFHSYSDDRGAHFTRPRLVDVPAVSGLDLSVSAQGELYLAASDGDARVMRVLHSPDGGAYFRPSVAVAPVRAQWYTSQPSNCQRMSLVHASVSVDRSSGPRRGAVYLTWADYDSDTSCANGCDPATPCHTEVFVSRSVDSGRTWSAPAAIPERTAGSDRFFQWSRVDPSSGVLYVAGKESGIGERRRETDVFLTRSADGGASWAGFLRLSSASGDASGTSFQYGDYQGLAVSGGRVYAAWSDYRNRENAEIYVGRTIEAPSLEAPR